MGKADFYKDGDWNGICERCGFKYKFSKLKREWTGIWVCESCFEYRHPQDFVRGVRDTQYVPERNPDSTPTFVEGAEDLPLPPQLPELDT